MNFGLFEEIPIQVNPIIDISVRGLCCKPYEGHTKGCPNFKKQDRCPPKVPIFDAYFDIDLPVFAIVNEFNLKKHCERMLKKHPHWSDRQTKCVLYWQNTARKQLFSKIRTVLNNQKFKGYESTWCPEGMGVDVTQTMKDVGILLEWPPENIVRQIALIAIPIQISSI